jgi:rubredoxin
MLGQVQCPNCGGYKTKVTNVRSIGDFEGVLSKKLPQPIGCLAFLVGLGLALGWQWWFCSALLSGDILMPLIAGVSLLVGSILALRWLSSKYHEVAKEYSYECHLCGYQWTWRTDEPKSRVTVRPDLIVRGEQKLEEEERERRRRDEEAAAWAHYQRQKRK